MTERLFLFGEVLFTEMFTLQLQDKLFTETYFFRLRKGKFIVVCEEGYCEGLFHCCRMVKGRDGKGWEGKGREGKRWEEMGREGMEGVGKQCI